ncbi:MAG: YadA-like family protein, partial [Candidimonas sp.]
LGQTLAIRGGMADDTPASATSGANVITRTTADGINIELAKEVTFDSVTTGTTVMNTNGVAVGDDVKLTNEGLRVDGADPDTYTDLKAGILTVAGGAGNTIVINGAAGQITGLTNKALDVPGFATQGRAATEEQLKLVKDDVDDLGDRAVKYDGDRGDPKNQITLEGDVSTDGGRTGGTKITNVARGEISENSTDAINGSQIHEMGTSIAEGMGGDSTFVDGKLVTNLNVAGNTYNNVNDALNGVHTDLNTKIDEVSEVANAGWNIQTNGDAASKVAPGKTVEFVNGENIEITRETSAEGNNQVKVSMSKDIKVESVTANTVSAKEVAIENGPVINQAGIDMSNKQIKNLADGVDAQDAVNVRQLNEVTAGMQGQVNQVRNDVRKLDNKLSAGVAAAMATAALPQAYLPGKSMAAIAGGTWNGESGLAIGVSTISDNGKWVVKLTGNTTSRGDYGGAVGVGYQW